MQRYQEPNLRASFRRLSMKLQKWMMQCKTEQQKTISVSPATTTKLSRKWDQDLKAMIKKCCVHLQMFSSAVLQPIANIKFVSEFYDVDSELLSSEKAIFENLDADDLCAQGNSAATMVKNMYQNGVHEVLPVAYKVFRCSDHDPGNILLCWEVVQCPSPHENLSSKHNGPRTFKQHRHR